MRSLVLDAPGQAHCIQFTGLLSPAEADFYIQAAETIGFESVEWEYDKSYRDCMRVVAQAPDLAERLWDRIAPWLEREDRAHALPLN